MAERFPLDLSIRDRLSTGLRFVGRYPVVSRGVVAAAIAVAAMGIGTVPAAAYPLDHSGFVGPRPIQVQPASTVIQAPFYQQMDGSIWEESNCGPTSLSMALGAVGISAKQNDLRILANQQMGNDGLETGTSWASLTFAATKVGAKVDDLYGGTGNGATPRTWSMPDLFGQLQQGRPVVMLVRRGDLTDLGGSPYTGDHYIVALGVAADGSIVYHDPAMRTGALRQVTPNQLAVAWSNPQIGLVRTAMAVYR